jgi:hypothetical protein
MNEPFVFPDIDPRDLPDIDPRDLPDIDPDMLEAMDRAFLKWERENEATFREVMATAAHDWESDPATAELLEMLDAAAEE